MGTLTIGVTFYWGGGIWGPWRLGEPVIKLYTHFSFMENSLL